MHFLLQQDGVFAPSVWAIDWFMQPFLDHTHTHTPTPTHVQGYGAGDSVTATIDTQRSDGTPMDTHTRVTAQCQIAGKMVG